MDSVDSLAIRPYQPSLFIRPQDCIQCPHRADGSFCWSANTGVFMCWSLYENVTCEFAITFPVVPNMSCSFCLDSLCDAKKLALQLLFYWIMLCSKCTQHPPCRVPILLFLKTFRPDDATKQYCLHDYSLKEFSFSFIRFL